MQKKFYKRASFTIEITLLMPSILAVIMIIIYAGFYVHDRCAIERYLLTEYDIQSIDDELIAEWEIAESDTQCEEYITYCIRGKMNCPGGWIINWIPELFFTVDTQLTEYVKDGTEYVRERYEYSNY